MGFRLDVYNDNFCGLVVDYSYVENSDYFYNGNNVEEAMEYFDLYLDSATSRLKRNDLNEKIVNKLGINTATIDEFQNMLTEITSSLSDEQVINYKLLIPDWTINKQYKISDKVRMNDQLYKCISAHTSQIDWSPEIAPSLWAKVLINPDSNEIQKWQQPDSVNGYSQGERVIHKEIIYESVIDNNVWEPGIAGTETVWEVVE